MSLLRRKQKQKNETILITENMKTTVKQLAAGTFLALLLLVGNVRAEGTEAVTSVKAVESTLHLEKWMTNENLWNINSVSLTEIAQETEAILELEDWMISPEGWNINNNIVEDTEAGMELENWMINNETWNTVDINEETETKLTVENWMTSENIWNR